MCRLARSPLVCCCTPAGVGIDRSRVANSSAAALFFSYRVKDMQSTILPKDKQVSHRIFLFKTVITFRQQGIKSSSIYLFTGGTYCKAAFQSFQGADYQPEIKKEDQHCFYRRLCLNSTKQKKNKSQPVAVCAVLNAKITLNARINVFRKKMIFVVVQVWKWCMACSQSQAWTQTGTHAQNHTNKQRKGSY